MTTGDVLDPTIYCFNCGHVWASHRRYGCRVTYDGTMTMLDGTVPAAGALCSCVQPPPDLDLTAPTS